MRKSTAWQFTSKTSVIFMISANLDPRDHEARTSHRSVLKEPTYSSTSTVILLSAATWIGSQLVTGSVSIASQGISHQTSTWQC